MKSCWSRVVEYFNALAPGIVENGFTVTPTKGKQPVVRKWQNPKPTDPRWLAGMIKADRYEGCNVGIVCGRVVGIDLDADDQAQAAKLEALAAEHLGPTTFQRVGKAPRTLLLYRPADEIEKIPPFNRVGGCVDVLSGGRQFVAFGIHPDTDKPYCWIADNPATKRIEDVPTVTAAQVSSFVEAVAKATAGSLTATIHATSQSGFAPARGTCSTACTTLVSCGMRTGG